MKRTALLALIVLGGALGGACAFIDRFPDVEPDPAPSTSSSKGAGGGGVGGASSSASSSGSLSGGGGAGGGCMPTAKVTCYEGPSGTLAKGTCKAGIKTCDTQGTGYGPCIGQVAPLFQSCKSMMDTNCDGVFCVGLDAGGKSFGKGSDQQATAIAATSGATVITGFGTGSIDFGNNPTSDLGAPGTPDALLAAFDASQSPLFSRRFSDSEGRGVAFASMKGDIVLVGSALGDVDFGGGNLPSLDPAKRDVFVARFTAAGAHLSSNRFGDAAADQIAHAVAVADENHAVLTGAFSGVLDCKTGAPLTSKGGADVLVANLGLDSKMLWCAQFGDSAEQQGTSVAVTPVGNIVVVGWFSGTISFGMQTHMAVGATDVFVAVLDSSGAPILSRAMGPANGMGAAKATGVAVDGAGNVYVTGFFRNMLNVSNPIKLKTPTSIDENIFVVKLNANLTPLWGASVGDAATQQALGIAVDLEGNAVVTGRFMGTIDFGTPSKPMTAGGFDAFAAKLDPDGQGIWTRSFGDPGPQEGHAVATDNLGAVWLTGRFDGSIDLGGGPIQSGGAWDVFLAKLTP